jgi:prepilin-type N-terminal cleavage/methylation domain-containing protein
MNRQKGYTLVEIAIVLVIISLLIPTIMFAFQTWKAKAEELGNRPGQGEFNELLYELKTGKPCPRKGLVKGNGKKIGLLKHCPDTAE